jgi:hypothetical protein
MAMEPVTTQANGAPQNAWLHWQPERADVMARATGEQRALAAEREPLGRRAGPPSRALVPRLDARSWLSSR